MKTIILSLILSIALATSLKAQQEPEVIQPTVSIDTIITHDKPTTVVTIDQPVEADTTIIRIGKKKITIIGDEDEDEDEGYESDEDEEYWYNGKFHKKNKPGRFNGHWEAIELGFNGFHEPDYSAYDNVPFMSLNQGKSMEVKVNFYELNIGLIKSYVGLVSGLGLSFNSYRFENPYTLRRGTTGVEAIPLETENLDKTKLAVSYLNVPLLFEFQIPVNQREGRIYVNAGVVGGVRIGSHTKVKYGDEKEKDRSGFHMNAFNYAATARVGYKDVGLFATYSLTPLFEDGKGPKLTPFTIGISFSN